jgi:diguanylate cyclase
MCELDPESCTRLHGGEQLRDRLTGVYGRRCFPRILAGVMSGPRARTGLHLALIDCDRFRDFNLAHGQQAGDRVLVRLGKVIQSSVRESDDHPFRFGRDVFGVLFSSLDTLACEAACERIRTRFRNECGCTVSVGLAAWSDELGCDAEALLDAARSALARAKDGGRDCLCTGAAEAAWTAERA